MLDYQRDFLNLALQQSALRFGEFTLKSGRISPYFFNAGLFNTGRALVSLGRAYAQTALGSDLNFDMLFGPAYKGISLATVTAVALAEHYGRNLPVAFNRKEIKDHGEGGILMGAPLKGRVLIIDDVITAGTAIRESLELIRAQGAEPCGVLIALDREEKGKNKLSASQEITEQFGIPVIAIARLTHLLEFTVERAELIDYQAKLINYRRQYGI